jgi:TolA-binding protein
MLFSRDTKGAILIIHKQDSNGVSKVKYTTEQLEAIASKLREMPVIEKKKQEHSKQESIKILSKEIASLQKKGYTLEQISEALSGEGLGISTPTLKSYLQRAKPAAGSTKRKTTQTPESTPQAAPSLKKDETGSAFTPKPDSDEI